MHKKILPGLIFFILPLFFFFASPVYPHFEEDNSSVKVNLHIDPDDDPVAGEPAFFYFEITDPQGVITPENCNCIVSISQGAEELYKGSLFSVNKTPGFDSNPSLTYVFPEKGVYKVKLTAAPLGEVDFESMNFEYDLRITRQSDKNMNPLMRFTDTFNSKNKKAAAIYISLVLIVLIFYLIKKKKGGDKN